MILMHQSIESVVSAPVAYSAGIPRAEKRAGGKRGALNAGQARILWAQETDGSGWPC